jgi:hypothetical protein
MTRQRKIQLLLWTYFWLLIFEGALRKWVFPGLSNPLLVVRDPVAILAIWQGLPYLIRGPWRGWVLGFWMIGAIGVPLAVFVGHGDLVSALFGARILLLHLPLIFLFPAVFQLEDAWKFVKALTVLAIPMVVLMAFQYSLPSGHFVNIAPGGEGSAAFSGAMGRYRPPGTFSFITGTIGFCCLALAGLVAWLLSGPRPLPWWIWISVAALVFALPISISRTMLFLYVIIGCAGVAAALLAPGSMKKMAFGLMGILIAGALVSFLPMFQEAREVFSVRWERSVASEGQGEGVSAVLQKRVFEGSLDYMTEMVDQPLFGQGLGLGTHVGAARITGERRFAIAENVWGATIGELGPIFGFLLIAMRVALAVWLLVLALAQCRHGNALPLLVGAYALIFLVIGQTSQPTGLGFITVSTGLMLAACLRVRPVRDLAPVFENPTPWETQVT